MAKKKVEKKKLWTGSAEVSLTLQVEGLEAKNRQLAKRVIEELAGTISAKDSCCLWTPNSRKGKAVSFTGYFADVIDVRIEEVEVERDDDE